MAEQYVHTLIPESCDFAPEAAQVQGFLRALVELAIVSAPQRIRLRVPTGETRTFFDPFTKQPIVRKILQHKDVDSVDRISASVRHLADYQIELAGEGRPATPPLPIDFDRPYHVAVTVRVSPVLLSTSEADEAGPGYGEPCANPRATGSFANPHNLERIEVAGAGCSRFWIEIRLGKFLFPDIQNNNLQILHPSVVDAATASFGVPFVQGLGPYD